MSFGIIRAYRSIDNPFFYNSKFPATEPDGSMAGHPRSLRSRLWRDDGGFLLCAVTSSKVRGKP